MHNYMQAHIMEYTYAVLLLELLEHIPVVHPLAQLHCEGKSNLLQFLKSHFKQLGIGKALFLF